MRVSIAYHSRDCEGVNSCWPSTRRTVHMRRSTCRTDTGSVSTRPTRSPGAYLSAVLFMFTVPPSTKANRDRSSSSPSTTERPHPARRVTANGADVLLAEATFVDRVPPADAACLSSAWQAGQYAAVAGVGRL